VHGESDGMATALLYLFLVFSVLLLLNMIIAMMGCARSHHLPSSPIISHQSSP
jgi:hypothetical protein